MKKQKCPEIRTIFIASCILFGIFLAIPMIAILQKSFICSNGFTLDFYKNIFTSGKFGTIIKNSVFTALFSAVITTVLAFILTYSIHFTNINKGLKKVIKVIAVLPMLLPTITYGFAIIYSFGKQGLLTHLFGRQLFDIYGVNGLVMGYVIYTLPISFMLINNTMSYIDKRFVIVSRVMGDSTMRTFFQTVLRPLSGTIAASIIQSFFLSITDFGIPASVGGRVDVIAGLLYNEMLGSVPDFNNGAVVAIVMLLPSIISVAVLAYLKRYNIRYNKVSEIEIKKSNVRDAGYGVVSLFIITCIVAIFAVIIVVSFIDEWPYRVSFTFKHVASVMSDKALTGVVKNSLVTSVITAFCGTLLVYGAALVTARSKISGKCKNVIESIAMVTNTIPGMVLGIAFMLTFTGTSLQNTIAIIIFCNMIHFFSTPYLMMKSSLEKLNSSWETTARLMGDSWIKTVVRIITPNVRSTLFEVFSYYFVNAMVTVSAVIFITGTKTMVITTKIKELQHFAKFNEIFVLSLMILLINIVFKFVLGLLGNIGNVKVKQPRAVKNKEKIMRKGFIKVVSGFFAAFLIGGAVLAGCTNTKGSGSSKSSQVVFYSNADDEAIDCMKKTLDENGYEGKYVIQSFGTSELGGKLLAEGQNTEADMVTMSSFYLESSENSHHMYKDLTFDTNAIDEYPSYYTPITSQEGAIIVNTEMMKENNLKMPESLKDLADPQYKGLLSVTDIQGSSTAWLMIQGLVSEYGEDGAKEVLKGIYENAGDHLESSGSGPIKKVRAGEVAVGFGLRHQAVADKAEGMPIDFVDPKEGNFSLTESVAVIDKGDNTNPLAMEMAECIIKKGRKELIKYYPNPIYKDEQADPVNQSKYPKKFSEKLTVDLLEKHKNLSESCK